MLSSVVLCGRVCNAVELRAMKNGTMVGRFRIAFTNGFGDSKKDSFIEVVVFGKRAESLSKYIMKGVALAVSGTLTVEEWYDKDNKRREKAFVTAGEISFLGGRRSEGGEAEQPEREDDSCQPKKAYSPKHPVDDADIPGLGSESPF